MATHLESKVGAVKLDLPSDEGTEETSLLGLPGVNLDNLLLETPSDEVVTGQPDVLRGGESLERTLVLVRLLELLPVGDIIDRALDSLDNDGRSGETGLLLLLGEDSVGLGELLKILSGLVSLEEVLEGGESEVVVDVVESWGWETDCSVRDARDDDERLTVLGNVSDDQVGVLPDLSTLVGLSLSDEELDEGRLSGSVGSEDGDTRRERDLEGDVVELLGGRGGVLESDVPHLHERLLLGLDSLDA
jgi:hypothetical protein